MDESNATPSHPPSASYLCPAAAMRLLVAVKRVIDYNARVRVKPDKVQCSLTLPSCFCAYNWCGPAAWLACWVERLHYCELPAQPTNSQQCTTVLVRSLFIPVLAAVGRGP